MDIPKNRILMAVGVLVIALVLGYWFEGSRGTQEASGKTNAGADSNQSANENSPTATPPTKFEVETVEPSPTPEGNDMSKSEDLPPEAQAVAVRCLPTGLARPEDTKTFSTLLNRFFEGTRSDMAVTRQEITFIDTDGLRKVLKASATDIDQQGRPKMKARLFRSTDSGDIEDQIPYELQSLDYEDLVTRLIADKKRLREKVVTTIESTSSDRSGFVEVIDGRKTEITLQFGEKALGCAYDNFSKANRCDCQDFVE